MTEKQKEAINLFRSGFNCAQSVFAVFSKEIGIKKEDCLKLTTVLGGGIARTQQICGAVSGALLVISYLNGKSEISDTSGKERTYSSAKSFIDKFNNHFGASNCLSLIEYDLNTEKGMNEAHNKNVFEEKCEKFILFSVLEIEENYL